MVSPGEILAKPLISGDLKLVRTTLSMSGKPQGSVNGEITCHMMEFWGRGVYPTINDELTGSQKNTIA